MNAELNGKRVLVTGASVGIGAAVARMLAAEGASVVVHGRDRDRALGVAAEIEAAGGTAATALGDLSSEEGARVVVEASLGAFGGIDILVNNAGGPASLGNRGWFDIGLDDWRANYEKNTLAYVRMVHAFAPGMKERGWGRIILISAGQAVLPFPDLAAYAASKAAINNLATSLSKDLANTGVTVNTVSPGMIRTPILELWLQGIAAEIGAGDDLAKAADFVLKNMVQQTVGRMGRPEDIAWAVVYLASPLADFVNGVNLRVDGGVIPTVN